jgi:hypothetical protein
MVELQDTLLLIFQRALEHRHSGSNRSCRIAGADAMADRFGDTRNFVIERLPADECSIDFPPPAMEGVIEDVTVGHSPINPAKSDKVNIILIFASEMSPMVFFKQYYLSYFILTYYQIIFASICITATSKAGLAPQNHGCRWLRLVSRFNRHGFLCHGGCCLGPQAGGRRFARK